MKHGRWHQGQKRFKDESKLNTGLTRIGQETKGDLLPCIEGTLQSATGHSKAWVTCTMEMEESPILYDCSWSLDL